MAFTCGFFNSQNGDRKYNAEQMASIFDGLIKDGVYDTVGDIFAVTPGTGMQVLVGSGRAWFDHTWNNNDAQYPLAITAADVSLPRYDAVVLETNHSDTVRTNRLRVLTGTPASNPAKPTMASSANVKQHPLAYIRVTAGATAITQSMIQVVVGTSECPFVTGIIETAQIDALFQQWNGEFDEWFDNLKAQLSDNVVANLQNQINQKVNKSDVATTADIEAGTSTTKWVSPKGLKDAGLDKNEVFQVGDIRSSVRTSLGDNYALANGGILENATANDGYVKQNLANTNSIFKYLPIQPYSIQQINNGIGFCYNDNNYRWTAMLLTNRFLKTSNKTTFGNTSLSIDSFYASNGKIYVAVAANNWTIYIWDSNGSKDWTSVEITLPNNVGSPYNRKAVAYFTTYRNNLYCVFINSYHSNSERRVYIYKRNSDMNWSLINSSTNNLIYYSSGASNFQLVPTDNRLILLYYVNNVMSNAFILMRDDTPYVRSDQYFATFNFNWISNEKPTYRAECGYNSNIGFMMVGANSENQSTNTMYKIWICSPSAINSIGDAQTISLTSTNMYHLNSAFAYYTSDGGNYMWTKFINKEMYVGTYGTQGQGTTNIYKIGAGPSLIQTEISLPYMIPSTNAPALPIGTDGTQLAFVIGSPLSMYSNAANILPAVSIDGCYSYVKIK